MDARLNIRPIGLEVADRLESAIVREAFAPGEALRELEICARFGVSRSPLREAFQILENRGLVERRPRLGTRVTEMSVENLDEIAICRAPLEATCASLLAAHPDHAVIAAELQVQLDAMDRARRENRPTDGFEANVRMTALLHARCGNSVLQKLLRQLDSPALRYRYHAYARAPRMLDAMIDGNTRMLAAIRAGDEPTARAVTEELVRDAWQTMRQSLLETYPAGNTDG
nr:GntR family transcriptional regulator [Mesobacterium pallidum]